MNVDRRLWRKVIRPKDIKENGTLDPESHVVFWPYTPTNDDEFELIPESTLKKLCPTSFQYLLRFKKTFFPDETRERLGASTAVLGTRSR